jgi:O-antigen/teichoic acid export membrane protein
LLGLDYSIIRFLPNAGEKSNSIINSSLTTGAAASIVIGSIFIAGIRVWSPALAFLQGNAFYFMAFIVCTAGWTCYWIAGRVCMGRRKSNFALAQGIIFNVFRLILIIVFAGFLNHFGILLAWGVAGIIALLAGIFLFIPHILRGYRPIPGINWSALNPMLRYSGANYLVALLWFGAIYLMPLMVINVSDETENSYFFMAWQIINILFAIPIAVSFSLLAEGSYDEKKLGTNTKRSLIFSFAILIPAILFVILLGNWILNFFGTNYAENGINMLRISALSAIPIAFNQIYFSFKRVQMKMRSVIAINAFTASGSIILSYFLLKQMGITGVGVAWLSVHGIAALAIGINWIRDLVKPGRAA